MRIKRHAYMELLLAVAFCFSPGATAAEAASHRIENVPLFGQYPELPSGCESAGVAMVLQWAGANVTKTDVASAIKRQPMPYLSNGTLHGGDPNEGFVGNPFVKESFGVFAKPMVDVVDQFLPGRGVDLSGKSFDELLNVVDAGQPVAAWVTNKLQDPVHNATWRTEDGHTVYWQTPEHVMTIIGYNDEQIVVNDPADGTLRFYDRAQFQKVWEQMGRHALTIASTPQPKYAVYQNDTLLREYSTLAESNEYAKLWAHSRVVEKATGRLAWDNIGSQVYQNDTYLGDFASQRGAVGYAKLWAHAKVVDILTGAVTWDNWPKDVYQNDTLIREFGHDDADLAISYAKEYANSRVVNSLTGDVIWKFPGT